MKEKREWKLEGYKGTTAFTGIGVYGFEYGPDVNKVFVADVLDGKPVYTPRRCTVYNNLNGHVFFVHHGRREYLMEYMKVGRW